MVNKVILIGRIGKDPDVKTTQNGTQIANLSMATTEQWKDKTGERQKRTEWHRLVVVGPLCSVVENYVHKGDLLYIEGKIQTRQWERDGQQQYTTEIFVRELQMLGGKKDNYDSKVDQAKEHFGAKPVQQDDDLPF
jgi:single-strand DNA-binding protein